MKIKLTKKIIEKILGIEINDYKYEPTYNKNNEMILDIFIVPKQIVTHIEYTITIHKTENNELDSKN